ncbi:hypothetical protein F2Q70_00038030 [Brassica cretica]|uniref:No apical meristem-associated C-terminal domain-containing protein n=1 Tax=Brassica cretica TaxID=69181 RepID=A0A8S9K3P5_BRACR|nr:hypothetical protein F2Q70_00038030 [Brassica cretica]
MVDPRFVSTSFFLSFGFSLPLLDDEKGDFFGSRWIFSPRLLRDVFSVSVSPLLDSSATSPWRFLPLFDSVALLGDTALSLSVGLVDEGKRRSVYWWLSETQINAGECCSGESKVFQSSVYGWMKTHDPGSPDQKRTLVDRAHEIYYNNYKKNFTLEHAWVGLRNDQKWSDLSTAKNEGNSRKRKGDEGEDSATSQATQNKRPPGVKAAKASGKKPMVQENAVNEFEKMWSIRQHDLVVKERLSKMSLLEGLIAKQEPLAEDEASLKKKLISDLMFN